MRMSVAWLGRMALAVAPILWVAALQEPTASAACVLVPQAAGLERGLERRTIGACTSAPATAPNGDVVQPTTTGLIVVRVLDGHAAFTDGVRTWVDGPSGIQRRMNGDRFDWETASRAISTVTSRSLVTVAENRPLVLERVTPAGSASSRSRTSRFDSPFVKG